MAYDRKFYSSFLLLAILAVVSFEANAMKCQMPLGLELSCPTMFNNEDKAFCCTSRDIPYCCDIGEYITNNTAIITGMLVVAAVLLILVTLCCCCCCSCCWLAKRRVQQGTVLYDPVSTAHPVSSPYPPQYAVTTHSPPPVNAPYPSSAYPMTDQPPPVNVPYPSSAYPMTDQPPLNPYYKH